MAESQSGGAGGDARKVDLPLEPWQRMAKHVHLLLQSHPLLAEMKKEFGWIGLSDHERAIWAHVGNPDRGTYPFEARIAQERWWEPVTRRQGDHLANRLAMELRAKWEAASGDAAEAREAEE